MTVEPLWRWLRDDVTTITTFPPGEDPIPHANAFQPRVIADYSGIAERLWVKDYLYPGKKTAVLEINVAQSALASHGAESLHRRG